MTCKCCYAEAIADEPETTADIQIMNKEFRPVLRDLERNVRTLAKIVNEQDRAKLVAKYKQVRRALAADPNSERQRTTFEKVTEAQSAGSTRQLELKTRRPLSLRRTRDTRCFPRGERELQS